jgi:hypothetical protein
MSDEGASILFLERGMFWAIVLCCVAVVLIARFLVRFSNVFTF